VPGSVTGRETSTDYADRLIRFLETNSAAFTDYAKRFVASSLPVWPNSRIRAEAEETLKGLPLTARILLALEALKPCGYS
jgi:hypothetical protein